MRRLRARAERMIKDCAPRPFWSPATVLAGLAAVYGGLAALRADLYRFGIFKSRRLPCPVISVGNLTVGGTGKTPLAMDLAARLQAMGWRVCVLSRGYRGRAERQGAVVGDGRRVLSSAAEAGDEPYMMACRLAGVPVLVGRDRWAAGMVAIERFGAQVAVLDDGYQHLRLARDVNLLLLDPRDPSQYGWTLPRGRLREPLRAARRSDALVLVGRGAGAAAMAPPGFLTGWPRLAVWLKPYAAQVLFAGEAGRTGEADAAAYLAGRRCAVFAGIADNKRFFTDAGILGAEVAADFSFADHHPYSAADLGRIMAAARRVGAECLVTTAKDQVRLAGAGTLDLPLVVIDLKVVWDDGGAGIQSFVEGRLGRPPTSLRT